MEESWSVCVLVCFATTEQRGLVKVLDTLI